MYSIIHIHNKTVILVLCTMIPGSFQHKFLPFNKLQLKDFVPNFEELKTWAAYTDSFLYVPLKINPPQFKVSGHSLVINIFNTVSTKISTDQHHLCTEQHRNGNITLPLGKLCGPTNSRKSENIGIYRLLVPSKIYQNDLLYDIWYNEWIFQVANHFRINFTSVQFRLLFADEEQIEKLCIRGPKTCINEFCGYLPQFSFILPKKSLSMYLSVTHSDDYKVHIIYQVLDARLFGIVSKNHEHCSEKYKERLKTKVILHHIIISTYIHLQIYHIKVKKYQFIQLCSYDNATYRATAYDGLDTSGSAIFFVLEGNMCRNLTAFQAIIWLYTKAEVKESNKSTYNVLFFQKPF